MGLKEKGKKETKVHGFLKIIPRARMGSESIAHEAGRPNGLLATIDSEAMRERGIIVLVKSN